MPKKTTKLSHEQMRLEIAKELGHTITLCRKALALGNPQLANDMAQLVLDRLRDADLELHTIIITNSLVAYQHAVLKVIEDEAEGEEGPGKAEAEAEPDEVEPQEPAEKLPNSQSQ